MVHELGGQCYVYTRLILTEKSDVFEELSKTFSNDLTEKHHDSTE